MAQTLQYFSAPSEDAERGHITGESVDKHAHLLRKQRSLHFYLHMKLKAALLEWRIKRSKDIRKKIDLQFELKKTLMLCNYSKRLRKSWRSGCGALVGLDEE